jgi:hypothetical protein
MLFGFAEVWRVEKFLQADDLRALARTCFSARATLAAVSAVA